MRPATWFWRGAALLAVCVLAGGCGSGSQAVTMITVPLHGDEGSLGEATGYCESYYHGISDVQSCVSGFTEGYASGEGNQDAEGVAVACPSLPDPPACAAGYRFGETDGSNSAGQGVQIAPTTSTPHRTVDFTQDLTGSQAGHWPYSASIDRIYTSQAGLPGGGGGHTQSQTFLVVQVMITDLTGGQQLPLPSLDVVCRVPGVGYLGVGAAPLADVGWDTGVDEAPDPNGIQTTLPDDWDEEWAVPISTDASVVRCRLDSESDAGDPAVPYSIHVEGSGWLN